MISPRVSLCKGAAGFGLESTIMGDGPDLMQRLDDLEAHIAHQDSTIDDLNQVVIEQWNEIKALGEKIARLGSKIQTMAEASETESGSEPPPPHY